MSLMYRCHMLGTVCVCVLHCDEQWPVTYEMVIHWWLPNSFVEGGRFVFCSAGDVEIKESDG